MGEHDATVRNEGASDRGKDARGRGEAPLEPPCLRGGRPWAVVDGEKHGVRERDQWCDCGLTVDDLARDLLDGVGVALRCEANECLDEVGEVGGCESADLGGAPVRSSKECAEAAV